MKAYRPFAVANELGRVGILALALLGQTIPTALAQQAAFSGPDAEVPIAPILPVEFEGWTNAIRIANTNIELIIAPALGRIISLRFQNGANLLRFDQSLAGFIPDKKQGQWVNAGGEWLWPMAQSSWPRLGESDWPPPAPLADASWNATAWKAADGSLNCALTRQYGRPLYIKVSRQIRLDALTPTFTIRQRAERTRGSDVPISLWNVFQITGAQLVFMSVHQESQFKDGFRPMMFDAPPEDQYLLCGNVLAYRPVAGEHKLCSDSPRGWIAAQREDALVLVRVFNASSVTNYPDGGCVLEMYSNAGLGYTEIETLSSEVVLANGDSLENEIFVQCAPAITDTNPCAIAAVLQTMTGERMLDATKSGTQAADPAILSAPETTEE